MGPIYNDIQNEKVM